MNNSGKTFHLEVASRDFENEYEKLLKKSNPHVAQKLKESLKKWAESEFKTDPQLVLIPTLYGKLKTKGVDFSSTEIMVSLKSCLQICNVVVLLVCCQRRANNNLEINCYHCDSSRAKLRVHTPSLY